ncbi:MAG: acyl-CoA thioesterase [Rhodothermales bacterium]|nr:acyl-CoA thioesterase [Rhodothermales bacterium]
MSERPEGRKLSYVHEHRVRYRECDPMGVVYHTHYMDWFEEARTEALREMGLPYRELEDSGVMMPVVEAHLRYHRPAYYDDLLHIHTSFSLSPGAARVVFDYSVRRHDADTDLVTGTVTLCFVDTERGRPVRAPERVLAVVELESAADRMQDSTSPRNSTRPT